MSSQISKDWDKAIKNKMKQDAKNNTILSGLTPEDLKNYKRWKMNRLKELWKEYWKACSSDCSTTKHEVFKQIKELQKT